MDWLYWQSVPVFWRVCVVGTNVELELRLALNPDEQATKTRCNYFSDHSLHHGTGVGATRFRHSHLPARTGNLGLAAADDRIWGF